MEKTKVIIDIRSKQMDCKITAKKVSEDTGTPITNIQHWMKVKAPDVVVAVFKIAKNNNQKVINVSELGIENSALNFIQSCKNLYEWDFMEIVKEVKV